MRLLLNQAYRYLVQHPRQVAAFMNNGIEDIVADKIIPTKPADVFLLLAYNKHLERNPLQGEDLHDTVLRNCRTEVKKAITKWIKIGDRRGEYDRYKDRQSIRRTRRDRKRSARRNG